jgi:decaprenyl-phosphate phosphoribosyltransferase
MSKDGQTVVSPQRVVSQQNNVIDHENNIVKDKNRPAASLRAYIQIARPDEWFKNIFILPGMLFCLAVFNTPFTTTLLLKIIFGVMSACLVASANYVINEYLDAEFDKYHPKKKNRASVVSVVNPKIVYAEYVLLAIVGLTLGYLVSFKFFGAALLLLVMGIIYNVRPIRSKERVYVDVLSESVNNPIRFAMGWLIFVPDVGLHLDNRWDIEFFNTIPPLSIIIAYWMGGAFLMATKRFAEYRMIGDPEIAGLYRRSFKYYTENSLLISMFFYAIACAFFLGIFLIKNKIEMLVSFPFFSLLFAWYLKIALMKDSPVQGFEKLYTHKYFMAYCALFAVLIIVLMFADIHWLRWFLIRTRH